METIEITQDNYSEYLIEKQNSDGKKIIEIKDGITSFTIFDKTILQDVSEVIIPDSVESIGEYAFKDCISLESVRLPQNLLKIGKEAFAGCSSLTDLVLPETLEKIGGLAFWKCSKLEKLDIPKSVTKIGNSAFSECLGLQEVSITGNVELGENNSLFQYCKNLKKLTIPAWNAQIQTGLFEYWNGWNKERDNNLEDITFLPPGEDFKERLSNAKTLKRIVLPEGMKKISSESFKEYTELEEIVIPSTVEEIDENAFRNCKKLKRIILPDGLKKIGPGAFKGCSGLEEIVIPEGVESLSAGVFEECISLKSIKLSSGLKKIKEEAFKGCCSLEKIDIPEGVEGLDAGVFDGCSKLGRIQLPSNLKIIGANAFKNCSNLEELVLPESLEEVEETAFLNCKSLKSLRIPKNVKKIWLNAIIGCENLEELTMATNNGFKFYSYVENSLANCKNLRRLVFEEGVEEFPDVLLKAVKERGEEIVVPSTVKTIKPKQFKDFERLTTVELPDNMEEIGEEAFSGCKNLKRINLPQKLRKIAREVFAKCNSLEEINIPEEMEEFGNYAFSECESLKNIRIPESATKIGIGAFKKCKQLKQLIFPKYMECISSELCEDCDNLEFVKLPQEVKYTGISDSSLEMAIGVGAFLGCENLQTVVLPENLEKIFQAMFANCKSLKEVELPSGIKSINKDAFRKSGITNLNLPDGIQTIEPGAFRFCSELSTINFPDSLESVRDAFEGCSFDIINSIPCKCKCTDGDVLTCICPEDIQNGVLVIPKGTRVIESLKMFGENDRTSYYWNEGNTKENVKKIEIPDGVLKIEDEAIQGFTNAEEVTMTDSVLEIGEANFGWFGNLKQLRLSRKLKVLPLDVYERLASSLECFIIPDSVERPLPVDKAKINFLNCKSDCHFTYNPAVMPPCELSEKRLDHVQEAIGVTQNEIGINYSYKGRDAQSTTESIFGKKGITAPKVLRMGDIKHLATLGSYTVDGSFTAIGPCAFAQSPKLESVVIEDGVKIIGPGAFLGCENLEEIEIPKSVEKISPYAFFRCKSLKTIKIDGKEVDIGDFAFAGCECLSEVSLPSKVTRIGKMAFGKCTELEKFDRPESVDVIDDGAFLGCKRLPVQLPRRVRKIGNMAFYNSGNDLKVPEDENMKEFRELAYCSLDIPENLEELGESAFEKCTSFKMVYFYTGGKLKEIPNSAFRGCTGLDDTIVFPSGVDKIGTSAFEGCTGLKTVTFPKEIKTIGKQAFKDCQSLENAIFCSEEGRENIAAHDSFENCNNVQKTYLYDMDLRYQTDEKGRIIGTTKETKAKKSFSFSGIMKTIKDRKTKTQMAKVQDDKRQKMENAITNNLGNLSLEQLEQLCNMMGLDIDKDDDAR